MEKAEQKSKKKATTGISHLESLLVRLLLVAVVLIITVTALSGYAISKYKQDYYSNSMRVCDIMAKVSPIQRPESTAGSLAGVYSEKCE